MTNTGNVTLDPVTVDDPLVNPVTCPPVRWRRVTRSPARDLHADPGGQDAGVVANTATATGTDPNGTDVTATDSTSTPIPADPSVDLVKSGTLNGTYGDTIDYTSVVTNTGNVTLDPVTVDDPLVNLVTCPAVRWRRVTRSPARRPTR
ncbi:MAG: hypothetical protein R2734_03615 [Nocardioides sp.]